MRLTNDYMAKTLFKNLLKDYCAMQIFCPITGEILDYRAAVILKHNDREQVISKSGLNKLKEKHGAEKIERFIATAESYLP